MRIRQIAGWLLAGLAVTGGMGSVAKAAAPGAITSYAMTAGAKDYGTFQTMSGAGTFSVTEEVPNGDGTFRTVLKDIKDGNVVFTRPVSADGSVWQWRELVQDGRIQDARQELRIVARNAAGETLMMIDVAEAWPAELTMALPGTGDPATEILTLASSGFTIRFDPDHAVATGLISSPADGSVHYVSAGLPITLQLTELTGNAAVVRFFVNSELVGTDRDGSDGFSVPWTAPGPGIYRLRAEITGANDSASTTDQVSMRIKDQIQLGLTHAQVAENMPIKTVVGVFTVAGTDDATVSLAEGPGGEQNGSFAVDEVKRLLTEKVFARASLAAASIWVKAVANDGIGGLAERIFVIGITDGPEDRGPRLIGEPVVAYDAESDTTTADLHFGHGIHGREYTVEVSNDLKTWQVLGKYPANEVGEVKFKDTVPGKSARRFWMFRW